MNGEERDRLEHEMALSRFGNKMPFSPTYRPARMFERDNADGNLQDQSKHWVKWVEEAFGAAQKQQKKEK